MLCRIQPQARQNYGRATCRLGNCLSDFVWCKQYKQLISVSCYRSLFRFPTVASPIVSLVESVLRSNKAERPLSVFSPLIERAFLNTTEHTVAPAPTCKTRFPPHHPNGKKDSNKQVPCDHNASIPAFPELKFLALSFCSTVLLYCSTLSSQDGNHKHRYRSGKKE